MDQMGQNEKLNKNFEQKMGGEVVLLNSLKRMIIYKSKGLVHK